MQGVRSFKGFLPTFLVSPGSLVAFPYLYEDRLLSNIGGTNNLFQYFLTASVEFPVKHR